MIDHFLTGVYSFLKHFGLFGAFLSMVIENLGIPLPTEIGYLICQNLITEKTYSYMFVVIILTAGHVLGALISYSIGRFGDRYVGKLRKASKVKEVQGKLKKWYAKYGNVTIFLTRFVGYVRPWSSFVAGFAKVDFFQFLFWTTLGSLLFNMTALYFSSFIIDLWNRYAFMHIYIIVSAFILFFGILIYELVRYLVIRSKGLKKK